MGTRMDKELNRLAEDLRFHLGYNGWNIRAVALHAGLGRNTVYRALANPGSARIDTLVKLAEVLDVDLTIAVRRRK
jgi:hypothetical protein